MAKTLFLLAALLLPLSANSEIQKWIDDQGNIHYGESKPEAYEAKEIDTSLSTIIKTAKISGGIILDKYEHDISRRSSSYKNFRLKKPNPELCRKACMNDDKCEAWTYGEPGYFTADNGRCWLQWEVSQPREDEHCISGVKDRIITNMHDIELDTNYSVKPYKHFTLSKEDPKLCLAQCSFDKRCLAWTYSGPNADESPFPRCWLKDTLTDKTVSENMTSGLKKTKPSN